MEKFKNLLKEDYKTKLVGSIDLYAWDHKPSIDCRYRGLCSGKVNFVMNMNNDELTLVINEADIVGALYVLCLREETEFAILNYIREKHLNVNSVKIIESMKITNRDYVLLSYGDDYLKIIDLLNKHKMIVDYNILLEFVKYLHEQSVPQEDFNYYSFKHYMEVLIGLSSLIKSGDHCKLNVDVERIRKYIKENTIEYSDLVSISETFADLLGEYECDYKDYIDNLYNEDNIVRKIFRDIEIFVVDNYDDNGEILFVDMFGDTTIDLSNVSDDVLYVARYDFCASGYELDISKSNNIKFITDSHQRGYNGISRCAGCDEVTVDQASFHISLAPIDPKLQHSPIVVITGETGSGKTYHAIKELAVDSFVYIAPCRQLVYESYMKYANNGDGLLTGEVKMYPSSSNTFAVYESAMNLDFSKFKSLIIDEAHFIGSMDRGRCLVNILQEALKCGLTVYMVTATLNVNLKMLGLNIEYKNLPTKFYQPIKKKVSHEEAYDRMMAGVPTIVFISNINKSKSIALKIQEESQGRLKVAYLNSSVPPFERLKAQLDFQNGALDVVVATDVIAQGLNFTCENMIIYVNDYDTPTLLKQKLGRLGRPFTSNCKEVTYYADEPIRDIIPVINKVFDKAGSLVNTPDTFREYMEKYGSLESVPSYNDIKYCLSEVISYLESYPKDTLSISQRKVLDMTLDEIYRQSGDMKTLIINNMSNK